MALLSSTGIRYCSKNSKDNGNTVAELSATGWSKVPLEGEHQEKWQPG